MASYQDLLTSSLNASPRMNSNAQRNASDKLLMPITSSAYTSFNRGNVEVKVEGNDLSVEVAEKSVAKNCKNSSKKQAAKRLRSDSCTRSNPKSSAPRKKKARGVEAADDNNNKTILPASNQLRKQSIRQLEELPDSVRSSIDQHGSIPISLHSTIPQQALQPGHGPQTAKQPLNVDLQILHHQQILRHHQQLQIDQQMLNFHRGQQELLQQSKVPQPSAHPFKKQIKLLPVGHDQQAIGHFPYKLVYNDPADQAPPVKSQQPPSDGSRATPTTSDKILLSQAPFLSKLTAPNFTVVDFSQLVKTGVTRPPMPPSNVAAPPTSKTLPSFPLPAHIFPPPNFMLYRPPMGTAPLMSPLSKPLFSEIHPSSSSSFSSPLSSRNASFVSFSSPLLSLPLFQPTNLVSTSMACTSKPVFSGCPPLSSPASSQASSSLPSAEVTNSSSPILDLKRAATTSYVEDAAKLQDECSSASLGSLHQSSSSSASLGSLHQSSSSSSSVSSPSGKSAGSSSESIPFEEQGINKFTVDTRKEILASQ